MQRPERWFPLSKKSRTHPLHGFIEPRILAPGCNTFDLIYLRLSYLQKKSVLRPSPVCSQSDAQNRERLGITSNVQLVMPFASDASNEKKGSETCFLHCSIDKLVLLY